MDNVPEMSREEMERIIKESERQLKEALARMSPEERERAMLSAQRMAEEDGAAMRKLLEDAQNLAGEAPQSASAPAAAVTCKHCGAPIRGRFCEYCGCPVE
ncbi:MAG: hypothetical protein K6G71_04415 [Clostridiales bacterium]|nr:hypothetical protein [Clostridiales bacterium]